MTDGNRIERDTMGAMEVPAEAYYGASTRRAQINFPISGTRLPRGFLAALGLIKWGAALANRDLGRIPPATAEAIAAAALEVHDGRHDDQFVVDVFQTGSGTSTNMNANEVIANRAAEILGAPRGSREIVHPNDHVNLGQSSNDVVPTAMHVSAVVALRGDLDPALARLERALRERSTALWDDLKPGRTHLQDATPIRIGQVFLGYAGRIERARRRIARAGDDLLEVALGGTAVGTGLNTHPEFAGRVLDAVSRRTGIPFRETDNHFRAQSAIDEILAASGAIRTAAVAVSRIADDLRWLASGPRCGLGEIAIPEVQPGSSIMPGKVNPVIAESTIQACAQAIADDAAIQQCAAGGAFELNTMLPLAAHATLRAIGLLARAAGNLAERCVSGVSATGRGAVTVERGLALATALVPIVGYDRAAWIAKEAARRGCTIREIVVETGEVEAERLDAVLDPRRMTSNEV